MAGDGEPADNGQNDETKDIINDSGTENDAGFIGAVLAEVAQHAGGDADAGGSENAADKQVGGQGVVRAKELHGEHAENHRNDDAQDGNVGGGFADAFHLDEADFQSDQEQKDENGQAGDDVDERIDHDVALALGTTEQRSEQISVRTWGKHLADRFAKTIGGGEGEGSDPGKIVTLPQDGEGWVAEVKTEIAGEKADEQFAEDGGLLDRLHEGAADSSAEGDEDGGDEDGDDRVGMGEFATYREEQGTGGPNRQGHANTLRAGNGSIVGRGCGGIVDGSE
jgi:hypothetical protein